MGGMSRPAARWIAVAALLAVAATFGAIRLTSSTTPPAADPAAEPAAGRTPTQTASTTPTPTPTPAATTSPHPVSLPAVAAKPPDGRDFRVGRVLARESAYVRYHVTYVGDGLTISGIMNVPSGPGPHPVVIFNHGYIDPDIYVNGQGLRREQDYLARRGYLVVHVDYRNHAQSDDDPAADLSLRLGYVRDSINALSAIRAANLPYADPERAAMLGRSMGGSVTMGAAVTHPDLFDAYVMFAPTSADAVDNFNKWTRGQSQRRALAQRIIQAYGSPEENPAFWDGASPITFVDRVASPVLILHGTRDDTCPIEWSERTVAALRQAGKQVELVRYDDGHAFGPAYTQSMQRTVAFLDQTVKAA